MEPCCFAYNSTPQIALGVSPIEALFGVKSRLNLDLSLVPEDTNPVTIQDRIRYLEESRKLMKDELEKAQGRQYLEFSKRHRVVEYSPGDRVLIEDPNRKVGVTEKLRKRWETEGVVVQKVENENGLYDIKIGDRVERFHIKRLRKFYEPT